MSHSACVYLPFIFGFDLFFAGFRNRSAPSTPIHQLPLPVQRVTKGVIPVAMPLPEADDVSQSTNMEGEVFEDCNGSFRSVSFRSIDSPRKSVGSSFRSIDSPSMGKASYGSFRSVESPSLSSMVAKKRPPSMEEIEWDSRLPPPLPQEQNLTIGDIAALCNSPLKFVFKCREIEHFNKFLRAQRKRLLAGLGKGNVDCFCVVLSGTDLGKKCCLLMLPICIDLDIISFLYPSVFESTLNQHNVLQTEILGLQMYDCGT